PDTDAELLAELLRHLRRIDADGRHLDAPLENLLVVAAELTELRHAERSPDAAVADEEEAATASVRQPEDLAVGRRPREGGERLAGPRPVFARAVHREREEEPAREGEDPEGEHGGHSRR